MLLALAAVGAGVLMVGLFQQSATAQIAQRDAQIGRACDAIGDSYRFYSSGRHGAGAVSEDEAFIKGLTTVVKTALRGRVGVEGGIWHRDAGSLAYAYPTYEGSGPKTDVPQAELPRIREINRTADSEEHAASSSYVAPSQTLLLAACPLAGPIPGLTAWTMTRVITFAGQAYRQLMAGLAILFGTVLIAAVFLMRLMLSWSRHVSSIEATITTHEVAQLPTLPLTGERELDRIVTALNDAGVRLGEARRRGDELARQVATAERLVAIGRVTAGVAHEIRNPIAAMRLKAENALAAGAARQGEALAVILTQIERLDRLVKRLLNVTHRDELRTQSVEVGPFLGGCIAAHAELANARRVTLEILADVALARFDPDLMRRAVDNLVTNALQAAPEDSRVRLTARVRGSQLVLSVEDQGPGPSTAVRAHLFEPFNSGRTDGTGLGLSIVREVAQAHGGNAVFVPLDSGTSFEIQLPWPQS